MGIYEHPHLQPRERRPPVGRVRDKSDSMTGIEQNSAGGRRVDSSLLKTSQLDAPETLRHRSPGLSDQKRCHNLEGCSFSLWV
ncbi:hypothetical protein TNCT_227571 [Trichonephila clavata]|uniref:Uncharacterized protein n=1 Tax=Trichonephila clavata TaxID=2740835 RepID=A0A8X6GSF3_TRICU|nr:hypothetical protein TNCT_227571 [Trichonephila clavata]